MVPNIMAPYLIVLTAQLGGAILTEASLSFLGLGTAEPTPSWGLMLSGGAQITTTDSLEKTQLVASYPSSATTWTVVGAASVGGGKTWTLTAYALCA